MINRISEIPFWGPEEQIRKFINHHDDPVPSGSTQEQVTQHRLENLDEIYQKQLIWSYGLDKVDDAYFYQDWCPIGDYTQDESDPKWQMDMWGEAVENLRRTKKRTFDYRNFKGYQKSILPHDEMPDGYDASEDEHAKDTPVEDPTNLDRDTLRHNIMRSYLEVSEWLGDGATAYDSHNGYVSRKMSLAWLFNAIKALINWKLDHMPTYGEVDIKPLVTDEYQEIGEDERQNPRSGVDYFKLVGGRYTKFTDISEIPEYDGKVYKKKDSGSRERFLNEGELSTQNVDYNDYEDLKGVGHGHLATQPSVRATHPDKDGILKVYGNEYHYGERAWFWTHNSFIGECRFFHNARFLGQATFDKEIVGTVLRSRWADLAEYKKSDKQYEPGTLVMFGGDEEVTLSDGRTANAIVTTKPGLVLNGDEPS